LRALISTWHWKARGDIEENTIRCLVEKLSSPPNYRLPNASLGHTRHYMPQYKSNLFKKDGKPLEPPSKIFDTFAAISKDDCIGVSWPDIELSDVETRALDILLDRVGYLGRAESWVEARRVDSIIQTNCSPQDGNPFNTRSKEIIKLLTPMPGQRFRDWRKEWIEVSKKDIEIIEAQVPADIFEALQVETTTLKKYGWSQPPGSQWVSYTRPADCFRIKPDLQSDKEEVDKPSVARYAIASQAPPRLTDAISVADRVHVSLVKYSDGSGVFTGCDSNNRPLKNHRHAHIFLESNLAHGKGRRGDITHVTIYSPAGFGRGERQALDRLRKVWGHGGHDIQLILLGVGKPADFAGNDLNKGMCPIFSKSRNWVSRTPFVPTRHPKVTRAGAPKLDENGLQIGSAEHELRRFLIEGGFPSPTMVERVDSTNLAGHETRWLHFRKDRKNGKGTKSTNMGFGFRIVFPESVQGPIALGYGCHFGLGLFIPEEDD